MSCFVVDDGVLVVLDSVVSTGTIYQAYVTTHVTSEMTIRGTVISQACPVEWMWAMEDREGRWVIVGEEQITTC